MRREPYFFIPAILFVLVCGIFLAVYGGSKVDLQLALHRGLYNQSGAWLMERVTLWGDFYLFLVALGWSVYAKKIRTGLLFVIAGLSTGLVVQLLKRFVFAGIVRPMSVIPWASTQLDPEQAVPLYHSFPSGHTTTAFVFFTMLALVARRPVVSFFAAVAASLVGLSRVYLMVHWVPDIMFGAVLGVTIALLVYVLLYKWAEGKKNAPPEG